MKAIQTLADDSWSNKAVVSFKGSWKCPVHGMLRAKTIKWDKLQRKMLGAIVF